MVHFVDRMIHYNEDVTREGAFMGHESHGGETIEHFGEPLDVGAAANPATWRLTSSDDPKFVVGVQPSQVFRKSKVNGTTWEFPDPQYGLEHTLYLRLPTKLTNGKTYTLTIGQATQTDRTQVTFAFDVTTSVSEAIKVNIVGYNPNHTAVKSADQYMWLGDGGMRDYRPYEGRPVKLINVDTKEIHEVGKVVFWKHSANEYGGWNLTRSDVWNADFSEFRGTGRFRLFVKGIGCSPEFELREDIYREAFRKSTIGFFFMRIGETKDFSPVPRQPRFIPGKDPEGFTVYLTTYAPWHPDWAKAGGDQWDNTDWSKYKEPGNPTNPNAWGGHSDAADWDRHAGHISIIWDLLLPYFLTNGQPDDDATGIRESGNGIPDIIDEAAYEVDFFLRLRDTKGGYSFGLNNPTRDHKTMYQAAARPYMAWANAANAAMLADAYRIAGRQDLMAKYRDAALEAWKVANGEDLDFTFHIGNGRTRGRYLKMLAAACLYNVTGDRFYEDEMAKESVITGPTSRTEEKDKFNQLWGTAVYLMAAKHGWRPIHHPELLENMRRSVIHESTTQNVANSKVWPSRRSSENDYGWFQSTQEVQRVCVAHAVSTDSEERRELLRALILEADYGLGRNPLNMVLMTGLGSRHAEDIYTSGRNDGYPGVHPGHTPYMNSEPWGQHNFMYDPQWYARRGYPEWKHWPHGEALWRARYCFANNEFTPQQTMRGKQALYGYLYAIRASE